MSETKQIMDKLDEIKSELDYINEHMVDIDSILTKDDKEALAKSQEELKKGETTSLEDLKKELNP